MLLRDMKHVRCPRCNYQATIIVDLETETKYYKNKQKRPLYYCTRCDLRFPDNTIRNQAGGPGSRS